MKPLLLIGLGNPLMGDEGVGCHVADQLMGDPRLPETAEVILGGTDLLRYAGWMEGRSRVLVLDALQDGGEPGEILAFREDCSQLVEHQEHAHRLSLGQAMALLRMMMPIRFTLLAISISGAAADAHLSPGISGRMPEIVDRVLQELQWSASN